MSLTGGRVYVCVRACVRVHKEPQQLAVMAPFCAAARRANGATPSIVLMPHASVTSTYLQNHPSCYCVLGCLKTLSQWKKSWDGSSAPPDKDRNRKSKDFFVCVKFSISFAMGRDAPQPPSIITLFHRQKHRKLFQQSYFSQWNIELISRRLWTSPSTWKGNRGRWGWREKCDRGQWEQKYESKK